MECSYLTYACRSLILKGFNRARKVTENDNKRMMSSMKPLLCKCIILSQLGKKRTRQNEQIPLIVTSVEKMNRDYLFTVSPKEKEADVS